MSITMNNPAILFGVLDVRVLKMTFGAGDEMGAHVVFTLPDGSVTDDERAAAADEHNRVFKKFDGVNDDDWLIDGLDHDRLSGSAWWSYVIQARSAMAKAELTEMLRGHTPWSGAVNRVAYRVEGDLPTDADSIEDGGQAMIAEITTVVGADDPHMFVRLQSWQDGARRTDGTSHATLRSLLGRRIRVTIEDLGPAGDES